MPEQLSVNYPVSIQSIYIRQGSENARSQQNGSVACGCRKARLPVGVGKRLLTPNRSATVTCDLKEELRKGKCNGGMSENCRHSNFRFWILDIGFGNWQTQNLKSKIQNLKLTHMT
jgi:hypothetical protein